MDTSPGGHPTRDLRAGRALARSEDDIPLAALALDAEEHRLRVAAAPPETLLDVAEVLDRHPVHLADDVTRGQASLGGRGVGPHFRHDHALVPLNAEPLGQI